MNLTDIFVNTLYTLKEGEIPESALFMARKCLLEETGLIYAGAALQKHHFFDAVFESDEVKVITNTKLSPRVRFIVRDVWQDGVKLPLDVMREAFGIEE